MRPTQWVLLALVSGCEPTGLDCPGPCGIGELCLDGECRLLCNTFSECPAEHACADGVCLPGDPCEGSECSASPPDDDECPPGSGDGGGRCVDIDECLLDNGGCDPLTECVNTDGGRTCGGCPAYYTGDGEAGCVLINDPLATYLIVTHDAFVDQALMFAAAKRAAGYSVRTTLLSQIGDQPSAGQSAEVVAGEYNRGGGRLR